MTEFMRELDELPEGVIEAVWDHIGPGIEATMERVRAVDMFRAPKGSALAADDISIGPYSVSGAAAMCLFSGMDHLQALKSHVVDGPMLHILSPFTLARGALENLSIAYWILHPAERKDRIEHALRWYSQNHLDAERAYRSSGTEDFKAEPELLKLEELARRSIGVAPGSVRRGHSSTVAVRYADEHTIEAQKVLYAWQLCSGFAHGRGWAIHGSSNIERVSSAGRKDGHLRLTANPTAVLWVATISAHLATDTLLAFDQKVAGDSG